MPKGRFAEDLSGKRYGNLTVIQKLPSKVYPNGRTMAMFLCRCDCGVEKTISATRLRTGKVTSCGCMSEPPKRSCYLDDLTGQRFGRWTVMHRADSVVEPTGKKATVWHCKCDCGTERDIRAGSLKSGASLSCGCLKHERIASNRDLTGQQFGRWTVIGRGKPYVSPDGRQFSRWTCKCECGTVSDVSEVDLVYGHSVSCGCYRLDQLRKSQYIDFTGRQFGELTAIRRLPDKRTFHGNRIQQWLCRCSCGKEIICCRSNLSFGSCTSCGHDKNVSSLETYVKQYLESKGFEYEQQKRYADLQGLGGLYLSYDFLVLKNNAPYCLIECQGRQHYEPIDYFGGQESFEKQQVHDKLKAEYADAHNIPLIEVPYYYSTYDAISEYLTELL